MEAKVKKAFDAGFQAYAKAAQIDGAAVATQLAQVFDLDKPFLEKAAALDAVFDDEQRFEELREIYFDLLMINFFAKDVQKLEEDYLDSAEWEAIEEETIDRGTELLNIFLYLRECADDDIEPSLDDYLKEFLLVEEDEFQDEYAIYEKIIANQILVDSNFEEISKVARTLGEAEELKELFYPIMSFFTDQAPSEETLTVFENAANNKALDLAIYQIIINFNK